VILNDQLSMSNKSKTATNLGESAGFSSIPVMKDSSELTDILRTSSHSDKFSQSSNKSKNSPHDLSHSQSKGSTKHGVSEAETGARTSQAHSLESGKKDQPMKDFLLESGESLKESLGLCEEVFEYVYDDDTDTPDIESFKKVSKLNKQMDIMMAESLTNEELTQGMDDQLESLERIREMMSERERRREEMDILASEFIKKNKEVADLPDDFDEVAERVSEQVLEDRRNHSYDDYNVNSDELQNDDQLEESGLMKIVKDKLTSTFYGFSKEQKTHETIKQTLDDSYQKKLDRIRELDKELALREKEEKAVKEMIKLNKQKERELTMEARLNNQSDLSNNPSGISNQTSKSDFFPTQPKKQAKKPSIPGQEKPKESIANRSIAMPGKRPTKLPSRPNTQQCSNETPDADSLQISVDFIKKNIEDVHLTEHERFLKNLKPEAKVRYDELLKEIEEGLDSDDPLEFRRVSQLHYENAYGYPPELQEKFIEIDERIIEMLSQEEISNDSKSKNKDVIRERVEKKEANKRIKQIDERVEQIRYGELSLSPEQLQKAISHEISIVDPETIQSIKDTIDLAYRHLT
jgi:hypothetical protein